MQDDQAEDRALEEQFFQVSTKLERKELEISRAEKALNQLKSERDQLSTERTRLRHEVMGDKPAQEPQKRPPFGRHR